MDGTSGWCLHLGKANEIEGVTAMGQAALKVVDSSMDKTKALEAALSQIERAFGKGSIMKLGANQVVEVESISTGSLGLDIADRKSVV